ncbi:hypothetical protein THAOC_09660, partial [Thalassiosira oceanica]
SVFMPGRLYVRTSLCQDVFMSGRLYVGRVFTSIVDSSLRRVRAVCASTERP